LSAGSPKVGKSLLVANLALSLAAGSDRLGFPVPTARRVLVCQFELPIPQFVSRLATMRRAMGSAAEQDPFVDTRATGHLLSAPQGLQHFLTAAQAAAAEIIVLDPLYSTHDQAENDTRAMAALCQSLLRLREVSRAALIVVHHARKSIGRYEIGSAFRGFAISSSPAPSATGEPARGGTGCAIKRPLRTWEEVLRGTTRE
jgi:RecA-family ATPase